MLVCVEVLMIKVQATQVKEMTTGETMIFEKKELDNISLKSHLDFFLPQTRISV